MKIKYTFFLKIFCDLSVSGIKTNTIKTLINGKQKMIKYVFN